MSVCALLITSHHITSQRMAYTCSPTFVVCSAVDECTIIMCRRQRATFCLPPPPALARVNICSVVWFYNDGLRSLLCVLCESCARSHHQHTRARYDFNSNAFGIEFYTHHTHMPHAQTHAHFAHTARASRRSLLQTNTPPSRLIAAVAAVAVVCK